MTDRLPSHIELNGPDYLMLVFDRLARKRRGQGMVCHLRICLQSEQAPTNIAHRLSNNPLVNELSQLRLRNRLGRISRWIKKDTTEVVFFKNTPWRHHYLAEIDINLSDSPPLKFFVYNDRSVLFSWHHALMDAHGAEILCGALGGSSSLLPKAEQPKKLFNKIKNAKKVVRYIFSSALGSESLSPTPDISSTSACYVTDEWSEQETKLFDQKACELGAGFFPSIILLAAAARAFRAIKKIGHKPIYIPVPHDRRRGMQGPILTNQLTFLYFRSCCHDQLRDSVNELLDQMQTSIAENLHKANLDFMSLSRHIPLRLYERLLLKPGKGSIASMFFSDIGSSAEQVKSFAGYQVEEIHHYPPHLAPPGLTLVCGRKGGKLFTLLANDPCSDGKEFLEHIKNELVGALLTCK